LPPALLKAREAGLILGALPAGARLVALDRDGATWSSRDFAERLAACLDRGSCAIVFAIGRAVGVGASVTYRPDYSLSLCSFSWPHFLVRGMLLEQLYRAQQILAGHPYHRE